MKYLILILVLLLSGCKMSSTVIETVKTSNPDIMRQFQRACLDRPNTHVQIYQHVLDPKDTWTLVCRRYPKSPVWEGENV